MIMSFLTLTLPIATLFLFVLVSALPARAGDISARNLLDDDGFRRSDPIDLLPDRPDRRDSDDWRRQTLSDRPDASDRARGVAARELLEAIEDGVNAGRWIPFRHRKSRGQEILATLEQALPEEQAASPVTEQSLRSRFRFHLSRGIEYRQEIDVGKQPLKLRVHGPIVSGSPGLGLQLRGNVSEHAFEFQAFGSSDEVGVEFKIGF